MIVDTLLDEFAWDGNGVSCPNAERTYQMFKFLRELILDSHLFVTKAIGFSIKNKTVRNKVGTYIARNSQIGESNTELLDKLSDKLFLDTSDTDLSFPLSCGLVKVSDITSDEVKILCVNQEVCRVVTGNCTLNLKVQLNCGYKSIQKNSAELPPEYFPMFTYFNINDYVHILPMVKGSNRVNIRYYHGMNSTIFRGMVEKYRGLIKTSYISEEELKWVESFGL